MNEILLVLLGALLGIPAAIIANLLQPRLMWYWEKRRNSVSLRQRSKEQRLYEIVSGLHKSQMHRELYLGWRISLVQVITIMGMILLFMSIYFSTIEISNENASKGTWTDSAVMWFYVVASGLFGIMSFVLLLLDVFLYTDALRIRNRLWNFRKYEREFLDKYGPVTQGEEKGITDSQKGSVDS